MGGNEEKVNHSWIFVALVLSISEIAVLGFQFFFFRRGRDEKETPQPDETTEMMRMIEESRCANDS